MIIQEQEITCGSDNLMKPSRPWYILIKKRIKMKETKGLFVTKIYFSKKIKQFVVIRRRRKPKKQTTFRFESLARRYLSLEVFFNWKAIFLNIFSSSSFSVWFGWVSSTNFVCCSTMWWIVYSDGSITWRPAFLHRAITTVKGCFCLVAGLVWS